MMLCDLINVQLQNTRVPPFSGRLPATDMLRCGKLLPQPRARDGKEGIKTQKKMGLQESETQQFSVAKITYQ